MNMGMHQMTNENDRETNNFESGARLYDPAQRNIGGECRDDPFETRIGGECRDDPFDLGYENIEKQYTDANVQDGGECRDDPFDCTKEEKDPANQAIMWKEKRRDGQRDTNQVTEAKNIICEMIIKGKVKIREDKGKNTVMLRQDEREGKLPDKDSKKEEKRQ